MNCPVKDETYLCETPCMTDKCPYMQGARDFAEWVYGKNFIFGARTKRERINMLLAEWQKEQNSNSNSK